jgi:hippurate hydrolase
MFRLGVRPADMDSYPALHNPGFNFNDDALPVGIRMFCELAYRFLGAPPKRA